MINHLVELPPLHGHLLHDVLAVEDRLEVEPRLLTPQPSIQYVLNSPSLSQSEKWSGNAKVLVNGGVPALRWACPPTPSSPPRRAWCRPSCASSALSRCGRPASPDVDVHNVIISIEFWWPHKYLNVIDSTENWHPWLPVRLAGKPHLCIIDIRRSITGSLLNLKTITHSETQRGELKRGKEYFFKMWKSYIFMSNGLDQKREVDEEVGVVAEWDWGVFFGEWEDGSFFYRMRPGSFLQKERGEGCGKRKTQYSVRALEQKMATIETFPGAIGRHISLSPHKQIYLLQGATPDKNLHLWFATPERSMSQISRCIF